MTAPFPEPENDFDANVFRGIQDHGWFVLKVPEDVEGPGFAFTVGLWANYQHPELIIVGLNLDVMHQILNLAGNEVRDGRQRFKAGQLTSELIEGYPCAFAEVALEVYKDYLGYAQWLYRHESFPALQCVWPDQQGYFPWQPQFLDALRTSQPMLGQPS